MTFDDHLLEIFGDRSSEFSDDLRNLLRKLFLAGAEEHRRMTDADYRARVDTAYRRQMDSAEHAWIVLNRDRG